MAAISRKSIRTPGQQRLQQLLRDARKRAKLSQSDVADAIELSQSDISKIEAGERRLDVIEFIKLTTILGLDPHFAIERIRNEIEAPSK